MVKYSFCYMLRLSQHIGMQHMIFMFILDQLYYIQYIKINILLLI